jgi:hypothetical protein
LVFIDELIGCCRWMILHALMLLRNDLAAIGNLINFQIAAPANLLFF